MHEILCVGNSHVRYILGGRVKPDEFMVQETDEFKFSGMQTGNTGATAWSLARPDSKTGAGNKVKDLVNEWHPELPLGPDIFLAYGEVDVREHIIKRAKSDIAKAMKQVQDRYFEFIRSLDVNDVYVMGCIPYSKWYVERNEYFRYAPSVWNYMLEERCKQNGFFYVDLYTELQQDGVLLSDYSCNPNVATEVHLDHKRAFETIVKQMKELTNS